jgi:Fic family protein
MSTIHAEKNMRYIYQHKNWPNFRWDSAEIASDLEAASFAIGKFSGRLAAIGFELQSDVVCETLSAGILNSAEAKTRYPAQFADRLNAIAQ